jgi:hypothetical protein
MRQLGSPLRSCPFGLVLLLASTGVATAVVEPRWSADFAYAAPIKGVYTALAADRDGHFLHAVSGGESRSAPGQSRLLLVRGTDGATVGDASADVGGTPRIQTLQACPAGGWVFAGTAFGDNRPPVRIAGVIEATGAARWVRELGPAPIGGDLSTASRVVPLTDCGVAVLDAVSPWQPGNGLRLAVLDAADGEPRWTLLLRSGALAALDGHDPLPAAAATSDVLLVALQRRTDRALVLARFDLANGQLGGLLATGETAPASSRAVALGARGDNAWLATVAADAAGGAVRPVVVALRTSSATVDWRYAGPPFAQGEVFAVDVDIEHEITARFDGRLVRLQRSSGSQQWSIQRGSIRAFSLSSVGEVALVSASAGDTLARVERLRADTGAPRWTIDEETLGFRPKRAAISDMAGNVAVIGEYLSGSSGQSVSADRGVLLDGATGAVRASGPYVGRAPGTQALGIVLDDGSVALVSAGWDGQGRALLSVERRDGANGQRRWQTALAFATPLRADDLEVAVPTLSGDGVLGVAATAGLGVDSLEQVGLAATIDAVDGSVLWQQTLLPGGSGLWPESVAVLRVDGTRAGDAALGLRGYSEPSIFPGPSVTRYWVRQARADGSAEEFAATDRSTLLAARSGTTILLREFDSAGIEHLRAVDAADGTTRWTRPASQPGDLSSQLAVRGGLATALFTRPRSPGPGTATDAGLQTFDLATGVVQWERVYPEVQPVSVRPVALKPLANGDWAFSALRAAGREGPSIRRVNAVTGAQVWQRDLPVVAGTLAAGGDLIEWGDGRLATSATTSWAAPYGHCRVCTNRLVMLDGTSGGILGWHATVGAQAPGSNGALDAPRVLASSTAGPAVLSWAAVEPAPGPLARVAMLDVPVASSGALRLRLLSVDRSDIDAGQLRVGVEASYVGSLPSVRAVVRAGAGAGVAVRGEACTPDAGASCGAATVAPMWLQAVDLPSGGSARLDLVARSPAWVDQPGSLVLMLEGDYRIADAAPDDQVVIVPLPTILLRDSFE